MKIKKKDMYVECTPNLLYTVLFTTGFLSPHNNKSLSLHQSSITHLNTMHPWSPTKDFPLITSQTAISNFTKHLLRGKKEKRKETKRKKRNQIIKAGCMDGMHVQFTLPLFFFFSFFFSFLLFFLFLLTAAVSQNQDNIVFVRLVRLERLRFALAGHLYSRQVQMACSQWNQRHVHHRHCHCLRLPCSRCC